jgi:hypothetical protein
MPSVPSLTTGAWHFSRWQERNAKDIEERPEWGARPQRVSGSDGPRRRGGPSIEALLNAGNAARR